MKIKKNALIVSIPLILLGIIYSDILIYGIRQGKGQLSILLDAKPIEEVLSDTTFPDSLKTKIELVQEIRKFAIDSLGLKNSDNYTTIYDQKNKPILWVVSACPQFSLDEYKWDYPFLGELGYKGFFEKELAIEEEKRLKDKGLDTDIGVVNGWSTLGWFKDPILSNMLLRSEGRLADLIIHELTHATIYVKGDAKFNENLATFVGNNGAIEFLKYKYGTYSKELIDYQNHLTDSRKFAKHLNAGTLQLDQLYARFSDSMEEESKLEQKEQMIRSIFTQADTISFGSHKRKRRIRKYVEDLPNNTFFTSYRMYHDDQSELKMMFEKDFGNDFALFLDHFKKKYGTDSVSE